MWVNDMKEKAMLASLLVICLMFSSCAASGFRNPLAVSTATENTEAEVSATQTTAVETIASVETTSPETTLEETVVDESLWQDAYRQVLLEKVDFLKEREPEYGIMLYGSYCLYDMDLDDVPELLVHLGSCEADASYELFTYGDSGTAIFIDYMNGSHTYNPCPYYPNEGILTVHRHMGETYIILSTVEDGKLYCDWIADYAWASYDGNMPDMPVHENELEGIEELPLFNYTDDYDHAAYVDEFDLSWNGNPETDNIRVLELVIEEAKKYQ